MLRMKHTHMGTGTLNNKKIIRHLLPFKNNKGMHCPGQVEEGLVSSHRVHGLLGHHLGF